MADHSDGGGVSGGSAAGDQPQSAEIASLREDVGSPTGQVNQLTALVTALLDSKKEEPAGTEEGAADRSNALESAAAGSAYAEEGASLQRGTAQEETDLLREPHQEPGPSGRHSGEAGGINPLEHVVSEVMLEYKTLKDEREKAKAKGAKGREQAYFADGDGRKTRSSGRGRSRAPPVGSTYPFLKPAVFKQNRQSKSQPKGQKGWYVGPAHNHPSDCVRMLTESGTVIITRNFTWRHVPTAPIASPPLLPLADDDEGGEGKSQADAPRQGRGGETDSESESDLDVMESRGPGQATPFVRVNTPTVPGTSTHGDEGSVPLSPSSGRSDFGGGEGSPTDSSSSSPSSNPGHADSDGGAGGEGPSEPGAHSDNGSEPDEMEDELAEFKFDSDDNRYPPHKEQTRQLQTPEEEPDDGGEQNSEEALLSTVLETENGQEIVTNYLCDSLVKDNYEEEQTRRASMDELEKVRQVPQPNNLEQQAFGAVVDDNGSSQQQLDPKLSMTSPIGQKPSDVEDLPFTYKDVMRSKYRVFWEAAIKKELDGHDQIGTFTKIKELPEGRPKRDDEPGVDKPVREALGCLMWTKQTRPDIALPLNKLQKVAHSPTKRMWDAIMRIMAYLNGTKDLGITYVRGSGLDLDVFADASYADNQVDRRSTTGLAVTVGGKVVCAATKTQPVAAQSTTEAEYKAAGEGEKEALFVRGVLSFIAPETSGAKITVREDNEGALRLIENPFSSARTKHIDVRFHFIRELFKSGKITAKFVPTNEQHADMLTKVLSQGKLEYHRKALM
eukprot:g11242.t1